MHLTEVEEVRGVVDQRISEAERSARKLGGKGAHEGRLPDVVSTCTDPEFTADSGRGCQLGQPGATDTEVPAPAIAGIGDNGGTDWTAVEVDGLRRFLGRGDVAECRADVTQLKALRVRSLEICAGTILSSRAVALGLVGAAIHRCVRNVGAGVRIRTSILA